MKINFPNQEMTDMSVKTNAGAHTSSAQNVSGHAKARTGGIHLDLGGVQSAGGFGDLLGYGAAEKEKDGKTLAELQAEASAVDVGVMQDYKTVLSNTLSAEDYAKAERDGFRYSEMDPEDVVTIQDKVKAEMAKGGSIVTGFNDDMDRETLAKAVGSASLAQELLSAFASANLPMTPENAEDLGKAWDLASGLAEPDDAQLAFLVENGQKPKIWDLYLAENSGAKERPLDPINLSAPENAGIQEQVKGILAESGTDQAEGLRDAQWLLERGLPVTGENLDALREFRSVEFPVTERQFATLAAVAIARGESAAYANLTEDKDIYTMAVFYERSFFSAEKWEETVGDLTARRQLEEVRLSMTAEVNVRLLESGFSIDTAPMEELIAALKEAERQVADRYFPEAEDPVASYRLMNEANRAVSELPQTPAANLGTFTARTPEDVTLGAFHAEGTALQSTYERAGESYEALMTAPRADLGDSIRKAFANVDDIARDLGLEVNDENRRAVRILGYNRMEMTPENIERVRTADGQVRGIVEKMTPASVLGMIRDGVNPLETSFADLGNYFDGKQESGQGYEQAAERYSEYLYALEQANEITQEERDSYIGIYRMLYQIEQLDGAAVGAVVNEQAQLQFSNLLSAVRSGKFKGLDVKVDDSLGGVTDILRSARSITEQIESAYREEYRAAAREQELQDLRAAANASQEAEALLERADTPASAENLLAAQILTGGEEGLFERLSGAAERSRRTEDAEALRERLSGALEEIAESDEPEESYRNFYGELTSASENITMETEDAVDIRAMRLIHRSLGIAGRLGDAAQDSGRREFVLPAEIGGEIQTVHLVLAESADGERGIEIRTSFPGGGEVSAHFSLENGELSGYVAGNSREEVQKLQSAVDIFSESLRESGEVTIREIPVLARGTEARTGEAAGRGASIWTEAGTDAGAGIPAENRSDGTDRKQMFRIAKDFLGAVRRV